MGGVPSVETPGHSAVRLRRKICRADLLAIGSLGLCLIHISRDIFTFDMEDSQSSNRSLWQLLNDERTPILAGIVCGAFASSVFPWLGARLANSWSKVWTGNQLEKTSAIATIISAAAFLVVVWLFPAVKKWLNSLRTGVGGGSFLVPAVTAFVVLRLAVHLSFLKLGVPAVLIVSAGLLCLYIPELQFGRREPLVDQPDDARTLFSEAWPERRDLAMQIASSVIRDGKPTYAVYGDFGSGKSSMLNFIEAALPSAPPKRPIIVRFNGWLPGSRENLADQLLSDIATECSRACYLPQLRRTTFRVARAVAAGVPHMSGMAEWFSTETQKEVVEDLRKMLERLPRRVVVLVDEVDRMRSDELLLLLKLIRGFTSLPNLTFICALERNHVECLIRKEFGSVDESFYRKFFVEAYYIPKLANSFLESMALDALRGAHKESDWFRGNVQEESEYADAILRNWEDLLAPLCTNAREINRLASTVRAEGMPLAGEVNAFDLTLVCALRCFAPAALDLIWRFGGTLCAQDLRLGFPESSDGVFMASVVEYLEREKGLRLDRPIRELVPRIRRALFPKLEGISSSKDADLNGRFRAISAYMENASESARVRRLRSKAYFPAYFQRRVPDVIYSERDFVRLMGEVRASDEFNVPYIILHELKTLAGNSARRLNCLEKLSEKANASLDLRRCEWAANGLVGFTVGSDDYLGKDEQSVIVRFVTNTSDALFVAGEPDERVRFVERSIVAAREDFVAHRILLDSIGNRTFPGQLIADTAGIKRIPREELERSFLERMASRYGAGVAVAQVDLTSSYWLAFHDWGLFLKNSMWASDRELQHKFWSRYLDSAERVGLFANFVLGPFLQMPNRASASISLDNIMPRDEIKALAKGFPPVQEPVAMSILRDIFGEESFPLPL